MMLSALQTRCRSTSLRGLGGAVLDARGKRRNIFVSRQVFSDPQALRDAMLDREKEAARNNANANNANNTFLESDWLRRMRERMLRERNAAGVERVTCEVIACRKGLIAVSQTKDAEEKDGEDPLGALPLGAIFETLDVAPRRRAVLAWSKEPRAYLALLPGDSIASGGGGTGGESLDEILQMGAKLRATGETLAARVPAAMRAGAVLDAAALLATESTATAKATATASEEEDAIRSEQTPGVTVMGLPLPLEERQSIDENLHTGIRSLDIIAPLGRGQSMMLIGGSEDRLGDIASDVLATQKCSGSNGAVGLYAAIGEAHSSEELERIARDGSCIVVVGDPRSAASQLLHLNLCLGLAEYVRDTHHEHALVVLDNLRGLSEPMRAIDELEFELQKRAGDARGNDDEEEDSDMVMVDGMYVSAAAAERRAFLSTQLQRTAKCIDAETRAKIREQAESMGGTEETGGESGPPSSAEQNEGGGSLTLLVMARSRSRPAGGALEMNAGGSGGAAMTRKMNITLEDVDKYNLSPEAKQKLIETIQRKQKEEKEGAAARLAAAVDDDDATMASTTIVEEVKSICDGHIYLEPPASIASLMRANENAGSYYSLTAKESCPRIGSRYVNFQVQVPARSIHAH